MTITKLSLALIITLVVDLLAFSFSLSSLFYFNSLTVPGCAGQSSLATDQRGEQQYCVARVRSFHSWGGNTSWRAGDGVTPDTVPP